jgi:hypothetical protein
LNRFISNDNCVLLLGPLFGIDGDGNKIHVKLKEYLASCEDKFELDDEFDNLYISMKVHGRMSFMKRFLTLDSGQLLRIPVTFSYTILIKTISMIFSFSQRRVLSRLKRTGRVPLFPASRLFIIYSGISVMLIHLSQIMIPSMIF